MNIHKRLQNVCKENTLHYSNVCRWVCRLNDEKVGTASVSDKPHSGQPSSPVKYCPPHPPYSPDLAPSDYHLFGPMKVGFRGRHYASDEEV